MPEFRDQRTGQQSHLQPEHWSMIRMPGAITMVIITMKAADTITALITAAMGIKVPNKAKFTNSEMCSILV